MVSDEEEAQMALTGLRPPTPLSLDRNLALNWKEWFNTYEIYTTTAGKSEGTVKHTNSSDVHI